MNFDAFLADCREQWDGFDDDDALGRAPHPRDRRLAALPREVDGFATENKLMLLNLAVRHMEADEVYVEVGTWKGLSLIGAAAGNEDKHLIACDDFSRFGLSRDAVDANVAAHCPPGQVEVHAMDYREFLDRAPWRPRKVGVYFFDGPHHFRHQVQALERIRPFLAHDAVILIDDTDDLPVRAANRLVERHDPALERVLDVRSPGYTHPYWWNGIQLFRFRGNGAPQPRPISGLHYLPRLLLWNRGVVYAQRLAHYSRRAARRLAGRDG